MNSYPIEQKMAPEIDIFGDSCNIITLLTAVKITDFELTISDLPDQMVDEFIDVVDQISTANHGITKLTIYETDSQNAIFMGCRFPKLRSLDVVINGNEVEQFLVFLATHPITELTICVMDTNVAQQMALVKGLTSLEQLTLEFTTDDQSALAEASPDIVRLLLQSQSLRSLSLHMIDSDIHTIAPLSVAHAIIKSNLVQVDINLMIFPQVKTLVEIAPGQVIVGNRQSLVTAILEARSIMNKPFERINLDVTELSDYDERVIPNDKKHKFMPYHEQVVSYSRTKSYKPTYVPEDSWLGRLNSESTFLNAKSTDIARTCAIVTDKLSLCYNTALCAGNYKTLIVKIGYGQSACGHVFQVASACPRLETLIVHGAQIKHKVAPAPVPAPAPLYPALTRLVVRNVIYPSTLIFILQQAAIMPRLNAINIHFAMERKSNNLQLSQIQAASKALMAAGTVRSVIISGNAPKLERVLLSEVVALDYVRCSIDMAFSNVKIVDSAGRVIVQPIQGWPCDISSDDSRTLIKLAAHLHNVSM